MAAPTPAPTWFKQGSRQSLVPVKKLLTMLVLCCAEVREFCLESHLIQNRELGAVCSSPAVSEIGPEVQIADYRINAAAPPSQTKTVGLANHNEEEDQVEAVSPTEGALNLSNTAVNLQLTQIQRC